MWQLTDNDQTVGQYETLSQARPAKRKHWQATGVWLQIRPERRSDAIKRTIRELSRLVALAALCYAALC